MLCRILVTFHLYDLPLRTTIFLRGEIRCTTVCISFIKYTRMHDVLKLYMDKLCPELQTSVILEMKQVFKNSSFRGIGFKGWRKKNLFQSMPFLFKI